MPKMKSHSGAKKRFKVTKNGHLKRYKTGARHKLAKKSSKRKRNLRQGTLISTTQEKTMKTMIQG